MLSFYRGLRKQLKQLTMIFRLSPKQGSPDVCGGDTGLSTRSIGNKLDKDASILMNFTSSTP